MEVLSVVFLIALLSVMTVSMVIDLMRVKEMRSMDLALFEKRLTELKTSRNGAKFVRFMKDNSVFIKEHETEVAEIFARVFPKAADSNN